MKIKCVKLDKCPICNGKGSCQIFFNKQNKIKYARVRHYTGLSESKKPQFSYCKIEDLQQLETLLLSLNFELPTAEANKPLGHNAPQDFHDHTSITRLRGQPENSVISINTGGVGFEPTTPTLGG